MSLVPDPDSSSPAELRDPTDRRARLRILGRRVGVVTELLLLVFGAAEFWRASVSGQPISRPGQIAFWAGIIGLVASVVRARVERARAAARAG